MEDGIGPEGGSEGMEKNREESLTFPELFHF